VIDERPDLVARERFTERFHFRARHPLRDGIDDVLVGDGLEPHLVEETGRAAASGIVAVAPRTLLVP
jgi:hypothetical protein